VKRTAIELVAFALVIVVATYLVISERDGIRRAQEQTSALTGQAQAAAAEVKALQAGIAERDKAEAQQLAALEQRKQQIHTSQQALEEITRVIPVIPGTVGMELGTVTVPGPTVLPDAPTVQANGDTTLSQADMVGLARALVTCRQDHLQYETCHQNNRDLVATLQKVEQERDLAAQESATWKKVALGGTRLHRIWSVAKIVVPIAAGAYVVGSIQH
jgi:Tfp pilus assembly protein PilN